MPRFFGRCRLRRRDVESWCGCVPVTLRLQGSPPQRGPYRRERGPCLLNQACHLAGSCPRHRPPVPPRAIGPMPARRPLLHSPLFGTAGWSTQPLQLVVPMRPSSVPGGYVPHRSRETMRGDRTEARPWVGRLTAGLAAPVRLAGCGLARRRAHQADNELAG